MTAETAVVLPVLILVALALAWLVALGVNQVRVIDAAREAARAIARGESQDAGTALGRRVAPGGAEFEVDQDDGLVRVVVTASVRGPGGLLDFLPAFEARAEAVAAMEPGS